MRFFRLKFDPISTPMGTFRKRHLYPAAIIALSHETVPAGLHWLQGPGVVLVTGNGASLGLKVSSPSGFLRCPGECGCFVSALAESASDPTTRTKETSVFACPAGMPPEEPAALGKDD